MIPTVKIRSDGSVESGRLDTSRLLFVHEVNWRRKVVYEIHDYPELMSLRGHECVFLDFPEGEQPSGLARIVDLRSRISAGQSRAHPGSSVEIRTPGRVLPPPLDRLCASITHVPALWRALRDRQCDAMVLYAVPTNGWQALALARHLGVPVLFRAIDVSHALRKSVFAPAISAVERFVYRNADWVSCNNEALRDYVQQHGASASRTSVDYPGLDLSRFAPSPRPAHLAQRYGIEPHQRTVMFMGTLYRFAGLDWFLRDFAEVLRKEQDVRLLIFGGGEFEAELRSMCDALGVSRSVIAPGFVDYGELADHIRLADIAINPFRPSLVTNCALPSKVLQYMGCGVPTVCTPLEGMMGMVTEGSGICYRSVGRPFVEAVRGLLADSARRGQMAVDARVCMERLCNWDTAVDSLEQSISRAIRHAKGDRAESRAGQRA